MLGILYILLCIGAGYCLQILFLPSLSEDRITTFKGEKLPVSGLLLRFPVWFCSGTMLLTWITYAAACLFGSQASPLIYGNAAASFLVLLFIAAILLSQKPYKGRHRLYIRPLETILFILILAFACLLMFISLNSDSSRLYVGITVFSDFTPHLSMMRSFSYGSNFPTVYSVCAGSDVRYHFMFEFLAGNLEFLGLGTDFAYNIPSILSFTSMFMLLYVLALKLGATVNAAILTLIFTLFRSSFSLFDFLLSKESGESYLSYLRNNIEFIGSTPNENWGLYNLNVYCNQRHFAFGITVLLILVIIYMPYLTASFDRMASSAGILNGLTGCFLGREGWTPLSVKEAAFAGFLLGISAYWNGAVLISTLMILFFMAVLSDHRLDYLLTAVITVLLSLLQTSVFTDESILSPGYYYGFLSENKTAVGSVHFLIMLCGALLIILIPAFVQSKPADRYIIIVFSMPLIFAFTVSLTPDIAVNHKYLMIAVMLLNIYAAEFTDRIFHSSRLSAVFACLLILIMTATGIYDMYILVKRDTRANSIVLSKENEITDWIDENTDGSELFCTANYYINGSEGSYVLMSGAKLYLAWQYFGWSAGYDTSAREAVINSVYGAANADTLTQTVEKYGFDYIIVDYSNRVSDYYVLNEELISSLYPAVYSCGEGEHLFTIYSTK